MNALIAFFIILMVWNFSRGSYNIDLKEGEVQFQSEVDEIEESFSNEKAFKSFTRSPTVSRVPSGSYENRQIDKAKLKQLNAKTATDLTRIESETNAPVDPQPVRFHSKNRLKNGHLMIVKRKVFGNSLKEGHRWLIYLYGVPDLGTFTDIMNNELGMDNKYRLVSFGNKTKYVWAEVRSNFIILK